ncbi:MAG: hypothetical protein ABIQ04_04530 [Candidatus Saccharimonadales bacterium]
MKSLKNIIASISIIASLAVSVIVVPTSQALGGSISDGADAAKGTDQVTDLFGAAGVFTTISNVMLYIIGAVSVIMIIVGGLRYVVSGGNSTAITAAKNTILYAVIGILVALFAYAMINFVIGSFTPGNVAGGTNV